MRAISRFAIMLLIAVYAVLSAACGGSGGSSAPPPPPADTEMVWGSSQWGDGSTWQ